VSAGQFCYGDVGNASKRSEGFWVAGCDDGSVSEVSVVQQNILANPTTAVALGQLSLNLSGRNISNPNFHSTESDCGNGLRAWKWCPNRFLEYLSR
jgi:hypothetical protein